jgi:hypothetical protein
MIVINVSFSLIITVFGSEHALAKITIVGFGEFCHAYLLNCTFHMYIMIMLPCLHVSCVSVTRFLCSTVNSVEVNHTCLLIFFWYSVPYEHSDNPTVCT